MSPSKRPPRPESQSGGVSRRSLLFGGAAVGLGAAAAVGGEALLSDREARAADAAARAAETANGARTEAFAGPHQPGVETLPPAHQSLIALDLRPETDREGIRRLLRTLSDDAARLMSGRGALADSEPELAEGPSGLTVTIGFGRRLVDLVGPAGGAPDWLAPLPAFGVDRLREEWSGGDLLLQIAADDRLTVAHAQRMLLKDARSFATPRWAQPGFRRAHGSAAPGHTQRNLFGQLDGTVNPVPGTPDFAGVVWSGPRPNPGWLDGGTGFVVRRIEMLLDKWDRLDRSGREQSVGRRLDSGAPLTGQAEHDEPDFTATTAIGFPVIAEFAHVRRARSEDPHERIFRRSFNYDRDTIRPDAVSDSGLIFTSFQHNVATQFTPVQRRLDELDLLNEWIVPIGSAVFAIPPGCGPGGYVGETLFGEGS